MINDGLGFKLSRNDESSGPNHGVACLHGLMSYIVNSPSRKLDLSKSPPSRLSKSTRRFSRQPSWHATERRSRRNERESRERQRVRGLASVLNVAGRGSRLFCKFSSSSSASSFFFNHVVSYIHHFVKSTHRYTGKASTCLALALFNFFSPTRKRQAVQNIG